MANEDVVDWSKHGPWPENEIECRCGAIFRSHSKWVGANRGIVTQRPCPSCGESSGMRRASAGPESFTIGGSSEVPGLSRLVGVEPLIAQPYPSARRLPPDEDVRPRLVFFGFEPLELAPGQEGRLTARPEHRCVLKRILFPSTSADLIVFLGGVSAGARRDLPVRCERILGLTLYLDPPVEILRAEEVSVPIASSASVPVTFSATLVGETTESY